MDGLPLTRQDAQREREKKKQNWRRGLRHNTDRTEKALVSSAKFAANCETVILPDHPAESAPIIGLPGHPFPLLHNGQRRNNKQLSRKNG